MDAKRAAQDEMAAKPDALKTRTKAERALRLHGSAVAAAWRDHAAPRRGEAAPNVLRWLSRRLAQNANLRAPFTAPQHGAPLQFYQQQVQHSLHPQYLLLRICNCYKELILSPRGSALGKGARCAR